MLTAKAIAACREHGVDTLVIGGGVAANSRLRALAEERCAQTGITLRVPRPALCTDNGAMVAALGSHLVARPWPRVRWTCRPIRRCPSRRSSRQAKNLRETRAPPQAARWSPSRPRAGIQPHFTSPSSALRVGTRAAEAST